jgi:hypothetical protein
MIYFTYQTKNLYNNKTYVGVHSTNNINDRYLGSGIKLNKAIKKYGRHNFKREILSFFDTLEEAYLEESFIINQEWVNNPNNYNVTIGGGKPPNTTGYKHNLPAIERISQAKIGKLNPRYNNINLEQFKQDVLNGTIIYELQSKYKLSIGGVLSKLKEVFGTSKITKARLL